MRVKGVLNVVLSLRLSALTLTLILSVEIKFYRCSESEDINVGIQDI